MTTIVDKSVRVVGCDVSRGVRGYPCIGVLSVARTKISMSRIARRPRLHSHRSCNVDPIERRFVLV